jgi:hypothetical protein
LKDGPLVAGQPTGNALSASAGFSSTVAEGKANVTIPLVLYGIPASYQLVVTQQPSAYATSGSSSTGAAVLDVYDADSNLIVGPGSFSDNAGGTTGFTIGLSSSNYTLSVNGGAPAATVRVTAPSDSLAIAQTTAALGAQVTVTPDLAISATGSAAFIRPTGFRAVTNIESAQVSSGATGSQLAPIADQTYGVGGWANYGAIGEFYTGSAAVPAGGCGTGFVRVPDVAVIAGVVWEQNLVDINVDLGTCSVNGQFSGSIFGTTDVAYAPSGGIMLVDDNLGQCVLQNLVPGVFLNPGSGSPSNCTLPHDLVRSGSSWFADIETNSSDGRDHVNVYHNQSIQTDLTITHAGTTAAAGTLASIGPRADYLFVEEPNAARLWQISAPTATATATLSGFISMPAGYTYVNSLFVGLTAFSARTLTIGSDGLAYVAVSSPYNGVLAFDPWTGTVVMQLPNVGAASGLAPLQAVSDVRGTIYWSAGGYLMHYPSGVSSS